MVVNSSLLRYLLLIAMAILAFHGWVEPVSCRAQVPTQAEDQAAKPKQTIDAGPSPILKEGTLQLDAELYLPDNSDEPRFVPNFDLGGFLEILRQRNSNDEFPKFSFEEVTINGLVAANNLELTGSFKVSLSEKPSSALAIPLRFETCQLTSQPQFEGGGTNALVLSPDAPGYRWWLKADSAGEYTAKITGQSLIAQDGQRKSVELSLPLAPSHVSLRLPVDAVDFEVSGQGNEVYQTGSDGAACTLAIRGSGGELTVSWRSKPTDNRLSAIEARSKTRFEIDDPRSTWMADSTVSVSWYGDKVSDEVTLRLPSGSRWLPSPVSSNLYSITPKSTADEASNSQPVELVIRFRGDELQLTNPLVIPVRFDWQPSQLDQNPLVAPFALPAIVLKNVDVHEGIVEYIMPSVYSLQWRVGSGSELVQQTRVEGSLEQSQYVFRFNQQSLDVTGNLKRESSLAGVRPTYLAEVDRNKIKLTAWLECSFDLTQRPALGVILGDWILDSAELIQGFPNSQAPGEALRQETQSDGSVLLSHSEPTDDSIGVRRTQQLWRLVAFRNWTADDGQAISLQVPEFVRTRSDGLAPDVDHGSGVLMVTAAENLQLRWNDTASSGLFVDSLSAQLDDLLTSEQARRTAVYRFQSGAEAAPNWSGRAEFLPRQITYQQQVSCGVDARTVEVAQNYALQIANEPLESLRISVSSAAAGNPLVKVNDEIVALRMITEAAPAAGELASWHQYELVGATNLRGKVTVAVVTQVSLPALDKSREALRMAIPLAKLHLPDGSRPTAQQLLVSSSRGVEVLLDQVEDEIDAAAQHRSTIVGQLQNLAPDQHEILLWIRQLDNVPHIPVKVSRAWLQTAVSGANRRDRFCARIQTSQPTLTLLLPATQLPPQVFVDGHSVTLDELAADRFRFALPRKVDRDEYTLEVWMWPVASLSWISPIDITIPRVEGTLVMDRFYWQLVAPSNHHLALIPAQFTCEWQWAWDGFWWHRRSLLNQSDLEQWLGIAPQTQLAAGTNRYVLSSFGEATNFQGWVVSRLALWLPVGLMAILASVILASVRWLRRPSLLMVVAVLIGSGAIVWPDLAVLIGQTVLLSLGLVLLMLAVRSAIDMRVRRRSVFTSRPNSAVDRSDHFSAGRKVQVDSKPTQTHAPVGTDSGVPSS